jgi:hypothetical protein
MKTNEEVFLSLVRNSLWDMQVKVPDDFKDWGLVMRLAKDQAMECAVAKAILDSPDILDNLKPGSRLRLSNMLMSNVLMHSMANSTLQKLVLELRKFGVECVLLKGQGLAANYCHPEIRECGDIDLYVGVGNYHKSYDILKEMVDEIDNASVLDGKGKHFHAKLSGISIEVHKYSEVLPSSSLDRIYQGYASEGLSKNLVELEFAEANVWTPEDNFNAFYVFNHLWNHFLIVGIGLRQLCDWAMLLHARSLYIDKEYLHRILTELNLMTPWKIFGCIVVDTLGLPVEDFPFYESRCGKKAAKILECILKDGDLGRETGFIRIPTRGYLYEKVFSLIYYIKRFTFLLPLFPYQAFQQLRFSFVNGIKRLFR